MTGNNRAVRNRAARGHIEHLLRFLRGTEMYPYGTAWIMARAHELSGLSNENNT